MNNNTINKRGTALRYIIKIAILSAIAAVVMLFEFPLPFLAPSFYELDLSEAIIMMGSFAIGPVAGVLMELFKNLLNILFNKVVNIPFSYSFILINQDNTIKIIV